MERSRAGKEPPLTRQISNQARFTPLCTAWGTTFLVAMITTNCFATQDKQQSPRFKLGHSCKTLNLLEETKYFFETAAVSPQINLETQYVCTATLHIVLPFLTRLILIKT